MGLLSDEVTRQRLVWSRISSKTKKNKQSLRSKENKHRRHPCTFSFYIFIVKIKNTSIQINKSIKIDIPSRYYLVL